MAKGFVTDVWGEIGASPAQRFHKGDKP